MAKGPTTGRSTRYQALDAWRGVVCLVVVLEHAGVALWPATLGREGSSWVRRAIVSALTLNLGAPLFFVISGYCIASSLDSSRRKGVAASRFLLRRLWRIFPPYWASVAIIGLVVVALDRSGLGWLHRGTLGLELFRPGSLDRSQWLGNLTLTETWRPLVGGSTTLLLNRVAWALCYQEQFYLICFLALVLAPKRLHGALGAATLAIVAFRVAIWDSGRTQNFVGLFPDLWHEFAVGLALYWRINVATSAVAKRAVELGLVALFAVGREFGIVSTAAAAAFGLILVGFHRWDDAIAGVRRLDPLRLCGRRSYAIYLIHLPVCTVGNEALGALGVAGFWPTALVMVPATTAASVAAGFVFYRWVDRRFTSLPGLRGSAPPVPEADTAPVSAFASAEEPEAAPAAVSARSAGVESPGFAASSRGIDAMSRPKWIRKLMIGVVALGTAGLAGDAVSGARHDPREKPDVAAIRTGPWNGEADAWVRAHHRHVERAGRGDAAVVFLGDSITFAWGDEDRPEIGQPCWRADFAPLRSANFGFPGDRTQHLLHRVEDGELVGHPRVVVVLIGTNNLGDGQTPEEVASGIVAVVDAVREQSPRTRVLLLGLLPRGFAPDDPLRRDAARVNAIIRAWAPEADVTYLDAGGPLVGPDGKLRLEATFDFVHPTAEGYRLIAPRIRQAIGKLLAGTRAGEVGPPTGATSPP